MDLKSTFETLKDQATDLAQAGVAQSKRLAEIAKLKMANMAEEDAIKKAYIELGKLYYAEQGATPDGAYASACERITASKALIETNNERINELKQAPEVEVEVEAELEVPAEEAPEAPAEEALEAPAEESFEVTVEEEKQD
ncbi:serine proteinase [Pseudoflavonifractor sp. 60]|uniref:serine proteinase n=1 Tax=Pseudoflavonifractor sp. 60 TaxID=2304576 RepID=UPI00191C2EE8|nr:serine proteinase [Pseudoflavonifractor sp. 60]